MTLTARKRNAWLRKAERTWTSMSLLFLLLILSLWRESKMQGGTETILVKEGGPCKEKKREKRGNSSPLPRLTPFFTIYF